MTNLIALAVCFVICIIFSGWFALKWFVLRHRAFSVSRGNVLSKSFMRRSFYFWQLWIAVIFLAAGIVFLVRYIQG